MAARRPDAVLALWRLRALSWLCLAPACHVSTRAANPHAPRPAFTLWGRAGPGRPRIACCRGRRRNATARCCMTPGRAMPHSPSLSPTRTSSHRHAVLLAGRIVLRPRADPSLSGPRSRTGGPMTTGRRLAPPLRAPLECGAQVRAHLPPPATRLRAWTNWATPSPDRPTALPLTKPHARRRSTAHRQGNFCTSGRPCGVPHGMCWPTSPRPGAAVCTDAVASRRAWTCAAPTPRSTVFDPAGSRVRIPTPARAEGRARLAGEVCASGCRGPAAHRPDRLDSIFGDDTAAAHAPPTRGDCPHAVR